MRMVHLLIATHSALMHGCFASAVRVVPCLTASTPSPWGTVYKSPLPFASWHSMLHLLRCRYRHVNARELLVSVTLKKAQKAKEICGFN